MPQPRDAQPASESEHAFRLVVPASLGEPPSRANPIAVAFGESGVVVVAYREWADVWEAGPSASAWQHVARVCPQVSSATSPPDSHRVPIDGESAVASTIVAIGFQCTCNAKCAVLAIASQELASASAAASSEHPESGHGAVHLSLYAYSRRPAAASGAGQPQPLPQPRMSPPSSQLGAVAHLRTERVHPSPSPRVRCLLVLSDSLVVLSLASGRALVWSAVSSPQHRPACDLGSYWLPLPPWVDPEAQSAPDRAESALALSLHAPSWTQPAVSLVVGCCAHGLVVWSLEECVILLCFSAPLAATPRLAQAQALEHSHCDVATAVFRSTLGIEVDFLREQAAMLPSCSRAQQGEQAPRGLQPSDSRGAVLCLLFVALRPRAALDGGGFWRCLLAGGGDTRAAADDGCFAQRAIGACAPTIPDELCAGTVHLLALTPASLVTLRRYKPPPAFTTGWDEIRASTACVAALSEAHRVACVWGVHSSACIASVRIPSGGEVVAFCLPSSHSGDDEESWEVWCASADLAVHTFAAQSQASNEGRQSIGRKRQTLLLADSQQQQQPHVSRRRGMAAAAIEQPHVLPCGFQPASHRAGTPPRLEQRQCSEVGMRDCCALE